MNCIVSALSCSPEEEVAASCLVEDDALVRILAVECLEDGGYG